MTGAAPGHPALLRPVRRSDAGAVLAAYAGPGMERQGDIRTFDQARDWVDRMRPAPADDPTRLDRDAVGQGHRAVFAIDVEGTMVGCVGVGPIDRANRSGWFWYWMREDQRGKGLTARAAATVATWALTLGDLERLELGHRVDNPGSGAVARAAGFVREGVERAKFLIEGQRVDVLTYGRLSTDPSPAVEPLPVDVHVRLAL